MTKDDQNAYNNNKKQQQQKTKMTIVNNTDIKSPVKATKKIDKLDVVNSVNSNRPQLIADSPQKDIRGTILQSYSAVKEKTTSISRETLQIKSNNSTEQNSHYIQSQKTSKKKQKRTKDTNDAVMIPILDERLQNEDIQHLDKKSLIHMISIYKESVGQLLEKDTLDSSSIGAIKSTILSIRDELLQKNPKFQEDAEMEEISDLEKIELEILDTCDEGAEKKDYGYLKGLFERYINESGKLDGSDGNFTKAELIKSLLEIRDIYILPASTSSWNEFKKKIINLNEGSLEELSSTDATVMLIKSAVGPPIAIGATPNTNLLVY